MTPLTLTIAGKPQPWRRARTSGKHHYKDDRTAAYQGQWAWAAREAMRGSEPLAGPLQATVRAFFPIPLRTSKARRAEMLSGLVPYASTPDADNVAKGVLDALNKIAFRDDAQVARLVTEKLYSADPRVELLIEPYKPQVREA